MTDSESLDRRLAALRLPVVALHRHGHIHPHPTSGMRRSPDTMGIGPDGTAYAVWSPREKPGHDGPGREGPGPKQITWHLPGRRRVIGDTGIRTELRRPDFIQPLPGGRFVLADARCRNGAPNAEVWSASGELLHRADLGDAIEDLFTTPSGLIWASYFDEARGRPGPAGHGLARFRDDLSVDWLYPHDADLPAITDCYTLNVVGETAHFCPYISFHLLSARGDQVTDLGPSPHRSAHHLLRQGSRVAFLQATGPEYDVVTLLESTRTGLQPTGTRYRLVLPDGLEISPLHITCRGGELHAFLNQTWFHVTMSDFP